MKTPIVLVHGLMGFDELRFAGMTWARYFADIPQSLRDSGNRVLIPQLSPTGGVKRRAQQLKEFIDVHSPEEPVHILAHSMGGLDSRYMISRLEMGDRVLSLTTLGTPHRGTSFADWGMQTCFPLMRPVLSLLSVPTDAFDVLTTESCQRFNQEVPDDPRVRYFSVAGEHNGQHLSPEWLLSFGVVSKSEGPNDGVVSVGSASYGEFTDVWEGHHLNLVNWPGMYDTSRLDIRRNYGPLLERLPE